MTAFTLATITITGVLSFTAGYILKHRQDTKHIEELKRIYDEGYEGLKADYKKHEAELIKIIHRYQSLLIQSKKEVKSQTATSAFRALSKAIHEACNTEFFDVSRPLPEVYIDIDFPNDKEDK